MRTFDEACEEFKSAMRKERERELRSMAKNRSTLRVPFLVGALALYLAYWAVLGLTAYQIYMAQVRGGLYGPMQPSNWNGEGYDPGVSTPIPPDYPSPPTVP